MRALDSCLMLILHGTTQSLCEDQFQERTHGIATTESIKRSGSSRGSGWAIGCRNPRSAPNPIERHPWRKDVIVTVNHGIRRNEGISVLLGPEKSVAATLQDAIHRQISRFSS
jgi:hypothetical protein